MGPALPLVLPLPFPFPGVGSCNVGSGADAIGSVCSVGAVAAGVGLPLLAFGALCGFGMVFVCWRSALRTARWSTAAWRFSAPTDRPRADLVVAFGLDLAAALRPR